MMKKYLLLACMIIVFCCCGPLAWTMEAKKTILVTTFPIYQITRNVVQGSERVISDLMLPSNLGCPHDYVLTPQDMQKLSKAHVLVVNGLGMEEFLRAHVKKANQKITVIDSSHGIKNILHDSEEQGHDHQHAHRHEAGQHSHESHQDHSGPNPHLFVSPRMKAQLAMNIAAGLSKVEPCEATLYFKNAKAYADSMNKLADEMAALGTRFKNNRIVQPHGVFDYLARDMGLAIVAVIQPHGQEPSASEMGQLVKTIKEKSAGAIFTEPQYPEKIGKTLAKETGIPVATLDPVATGPQNAPLNYYENVMRHNMKILEATLGTK